MVYDFCSFLLNKVAAHLKPFFPQLQRTFVKALTDANQTVRQQAASCLGTLVSLQTQVDPLVKELEKLAREEFEDATKEAVLTALWRVLDQSGPNVSAAMSATLVKSMQEFSSVSNDGVKKAAAFCQAALACNCLAGEEARDVTR